MTGRALSLAIVAIVALGCVACQHSPSAREIYEPVPEEQIETRLFFGSNIQGQPGVSEADWRSFLASEVTPRFPAGLTVVPARGQWRSRESGQIEREESHILTLLHDGSDGSEFALNEITNLYKERFDQEGVLRLDRRVWVTFE